MAGALDFPKISLEGGRRTEPPAILLDEIQHRRKASCIAGDIAIESRPAGQKEQRQQVADADPDGEEAEEVAQPDAGAESRRGDEIGRKKCLDRPEDAVVPAQQASD